jgi:hypothetical protein
MNPRLIAFATAACAAVALMAWQLHGFFAVEDDKTVVRDFFVDEDTLAFERHGTSEIPPLKGRGGKPSVVIARCFRDEDGRLVIGWLERYPDEVKQQLEAAWAAGEVPADLAMGSTFKKEVRRPEADSPWLPVSDKAAAAICLPPANAQQPAFPK